MPGMFIDVQISPESRSDAQLARKLAEVCPVAIFTISENESIAIVDKNLDECVLCDLCTQVAPNGAVEVIKLYD